MDEADPASVAGFFYEDKNPPAYMPMGQTVDKVHDKCRGFFSY